MSEATVPRTARARVRDELTREIKAAARRHLERDGAAGLSLRAVARDVGMVSSAVYRYFPSRDELLTALIIDAYNAAGAAAEQAEAIVRRTDLVGRWMAVVGAVRDWALDHRQEYALIFGSPVPGYRAPTDTIDPAARIPVLLLQILVEAGASRAASPRHSPAMPRSVRADLKGLRAAVAPTLPEPELARAVMAWTQLIGSISFELFGHLHNVIFDYDAYFEYQMRVVAIELGVIDA